MHIRFTPHAEAELTEARTWYARQRANLDLEFMQCVDKTLALINKTPRRFQVAHQDLRRAIVRRFPFSTFYRVLPDEIVVVAIFHSRRDPKSLQKRI